MSDFGNEGGGASGSVPAVDSLVAAVEGGAADIDALQDLPEAHVIPGMDNSLDSLLSGISFVHPTLGLDDDKWAEIKPDVQERAKKIGAAAVKRMGKEIMFTIQAGSLEYMLKEPTHNFIGQAPGGGGKTVAFCMGLLARIDSRVPYTQGLIVGMTRELARIIFTDALVPLAGFDNLETDVWEGKSVVKIKQPNGSIMSIRLCLPDKAGKAVHKKWSDHVVVGTPGHLEHNVVNIRDPSTGKYGTDNPINIQELTVLVLDEADEILGKFGGPKDAKASVSRIRQSCPKTCQILLYSATFPAEVNAYIKEILSPPVARLVMEDKTDIMIPNRKQFWMHDQMYEKVGVVKGTFKGRRFIVTEMAEGKLDDLEGGNELKFPNGNTVRLVKEMGDLPGVKSFEISCCFNPSTKDCRRPRCGGGRGGGGRGGGGRGGGGRGRGGRGGGGREGMGDNGGGSVSLEACGHTFADATLSVVKGKVGLLRDIYNILGTNQSIVFCNEIDSVEAVHVLMEELECKCSILHKDLGYDLRDEAIDNFRGVPGAKAGKNPVLVCTDVLARGVDIPGVNMVVNFDIPVEHVRRGVPGPAFDKYAHRIARTARAGKKGVVINFAHSPRDKEYVAQIAAHWGKDGSSALIPEFKNISDSEETFDSSIHGFSKWFTKFLK